MFTFDYNKRRYTDRDWFNEIGAGSVSGYTALILYYIRKRTADILFARIMYIATATSLSGNNNLGNETESPRQKSVK